MDTGPATGISHCTLTDGRRLSYAEWGAADGVPAFYFHGTTSSRLEGALYDSEARAKGVRLITVDRPGVGDSDPLPGRRLRDWPADVAQLADQLGILQYAVAGGSGGGPHALACAALTPQRVSGVVLVNTAVPPLPHYWRTMPAPMRMLLWLYLNCRPVARYLARKMAAGRDPALLLDNARYLKARRLLPAADRPVMDDATRRRLFGQAVVEGLRQNPLCFAEESDIFLGHGPDTWQFEPLTVQVPLVALCGDADGSKLFAQALIDNSRTTARIQTFKGGHLSALGAEAAAMSMAALASFRYSA